MSLSVDHHKSYCEYFDRCFVCLCVLLSQQNLVSVTTCYVATVADVDVEL